MDLRYRVVVIITFLLISLSVGMSILNYVMAVYSAQKHLKSRSLPLSVDNIYTEIQKHIIEPNLVSSMMANDTFVKAWLYDNEEDVGQIARYLDTIKNKYHMFTTFLVSEKTGNYYTSAGIIEQIREGNPNNEWYFNFKKLEFAHEINLDFNEHMDSDMIMFINYKIFDERYHMIGATGIGLKISYVNDMLKRFRQTYHFNVFFVNEEGKVLLSERGVNGLKHIDEVSELKALHADIISKDSKVISCEREGKQYLLNTKYVPELNLYLVVEAKVENFTKDVRRTFYFNLAGSLVVTLLVIAIILMTVKSYHRRLEYLAGNDVLTDLPNRRSFNEQFERHFLLSRRNGKPVSLLFFDVDNFKRINDIYGHQKGDAVLERIGALLKQNLRQSDLVARWGGEEFAMLFIDTALEDATMIAEKIRKHMEDDNGLRALVKDGVTASFGLSELNETDTKATLLKRVDEALYEAKEGGKNRICIR